MCLVCSGRGISSLFKKETARSTAPSNTEGITRREMLVGTAATAALASIPFKSSWASDAEQTTVFRNGRVYTVEDSQPWAQAVVVQGNRIAYAGDDAGAMKLAGKRAEVVDLAGRMMMPGFVEGHWHLATTVFARGAWVNYEDVSEIYASVRKYAESHPKDIIITGFGWMPPNFPPTGPTKDPLDAIVPNRPVLLISNDFHNYWVNSKFLEMAGVTKNTPRDVVPGASWYEKDPTTGEPTGFICEAPALFAVLEALAKHGIEPFTAQATTAAMEEWQPKLAGAGITTFFDAGFVVWPDQQHIGFDILLDLERRGKLLQRVIGSYYHNDPKIDGLAIIKEYRKKYQTPLVQATTLKLVVDGTEIAQTAYYLQPYAGRPDWRGEPLFSPEVLNRVVREADAAGIDMHAHCCGDAGVRIMLDACHAAYKANGPRDRRDTICHAFLTDPSDIPRFRRLGVVANTQIQWGVPDLSQLRTRELLGEERWNRMYTFKSFINEGVTVSFGMDALATGYRVVYKPLEAIQAGRTRQEPGKPNGPLQPPASECLSVPELIRGYTLNAAYQLRMEDKVGSIKAGKLADLIVLDQNVFDVGPHEIGKVDVQLTMMNGRVTHRAGV